MTNAVTVQELSPNPKIILNSDSNITETHTVHIFNKIASWGFLCICIFCFNIFLGYG